MIPCFHQPALATAALRRRNQDKCRDFNDNDRPLCQMYTVQAGDTATEIAQKYKVGAARCRAQRGAAGRDAAQRSH